MNMIASTLLATLMFQCQTPFASSTDLFGDKRLWYAARAAIRLSTGVYFDADFQPSKADLDFISHDTITSGGETAVVAYVDGNEGGGNHWDDYCMVGFRGRNYDPDNYDDCCTEWYDGSCWFNSVDGCYDAIGHDAFQDAKDIRDSSFTESVTDEDGQTCDLMNDALASDFSRFNWNTLETKIDSCLSTCKSDTGKDCRLYIVGHSQGGVYAQMAAMKLHSSSASYIDPYVITFGTPPAYKKTGSSGCDALLPASDHFINFVNMGGWQSTKFDVATSIGLDTNAKHSDKGHLVVMNVDSDNAHDPTIYVKELPTTVPYKQYGTPDYTYSNNDSHRYALKLHLVNRYKSRIENIVENIEDTNEIPNEDGFDVGNWCIRDWQCESNKCESVTITSEDTCCFIACWKCNVQSTTYNYKCRS